MSSWQEAPGFNTALSYYRAGHLCAGCSDSRHTFGIMDGRPGHQRYSVADFAYLYGYHRGPTNNIMASTPTAAFRERAGPGLPSSPRISWLL